jgi:hypothetical protein
MDFIKAIFETAESQLTMPRITVQMAFVRPRMQVSVLELSGEESK